MVKEQILQDSFLKVLKQEKVPTAIYLVNGIKLQGQIDAFDSNVVTLKGSITQMVYKHAISTIVPTLNVEVPQGDVLAIGAEA